MSTAIGLLAVLVAVLGQVAVVPAFSIFGVQPNLVLVVLVAWLAIRGREALPLVLVAGFLQGLLDSQPLGLALLGLAPLIVLARVREFQVIESELIPAMVLIFLATLAYEAIILLTLLVIGDDPDALGSVRDVLVPAAIANVLLLLPVYGAVRLASQDLRRSQAF